MKINDLQKFQLKEFEIDEILSGVNPNWKKESLYQFDYINHEAQRTDITIDFQKRFNQFSEFKKKSYVPRSDVTTNLYSKDLQFIIEREGPSGTHVLTNIEPKLFEDETISDYKNQHPFDIKDLNRYFF
ncbi:MAG: hypothetical protein WC916_06920 [Candidatus Woesearchaeota archaeon]